MRVELKVLWKVEKKVCQLEYWLVEQLVPYY